MGRGWLSSPDQTSRMWPLHVAPEFFRSQAPLTKAVRMAYEWFQYRSRDQNLDSSENRITFVQNADFSSPFFRHPFVPVPWQAAPFIPVLSVLPTVYRPSLFSITLLPVIGICLF